MFNACSLVDAARGQGETPFLHRRLWHRVTLLLACRYRQFGAQGSDATVSVEVARRSCHTSAGRVTSRVYGADTALTLVATLLNHESRRVSHVDNVSVQSAHAPLEQNYVRTGESITANIDALDVQIKRFF